MSVFATWTLAIALAISPEAGIAGSVRYDVDCEIDGLLQRVLRKAARHGDADIYLHGVCEGNFVIKSNGVTMRAGSPGSGLAAPDDSSGSEVVIEIAAARAALRGIVVRGGDVGVLIEGRDRNVLLYEVEVSDQNYVGVLVGDGAEARVLDSEIHNALAGIDVGSDSSINVQRTTIHQQDVAIMVDDGSFAAISDSTIENNREAGLSVSRRSDANVLDSVFRENGEVHVHANDWSSIRLLLENAVGSETDSTPFALGSNLNSLILSYSAPTIYGGISVLNYGSVQLGNTELHGDVLVSVFANAFVRNATIEGIVVCDVGGEAICRTATSAGVSGCASTSCGTPAAETGVTTPEIPQYSTPAVPRIERPSPMMPRR